LTRELSQKIDSGKKKEVSSNSAFNKFKQMDTRAQTNTDQELPSTHQNTITLVRPLGGSQFASSGVDGQLVIWDLLNAGVANLRL
jgi:actin related protein 2/3 complex subunit 1A/1B